MSETAKWFNSLGKSFNFSRFEEAEEVTKRGFMLIFVSDNFTDFGVQVQKIYEANLPFVVNFPLVFFEKEKDLTFALTLIGESFTCVSTRINN